MKLNITIIGFGNIGKQVAALLLTQQGRQFCINIIDVSDETEGAWLDFNHGLPLFPGHLLVYNNRELMNEADYIFHCAGANVPKGKSRLVTCSASIEITELAFEYYKPKSTARIIVIANPVEIIAMVTQRITGLPPEQVIGTGTFLDTLRLNYLVKQKNPALNAVKMTALGEHGSAVFISESLSSINGQKIETHMSADNLNELMEGVKGAAHIIKKTQGATIYGVSACAVHLFNAYLSSTISQIPFSMQLPEDWSKRLGLPQLYLSLPGEISSEGAFFDVAYAPSEAECEKLVLAGKSLAACIPDRYL